MLWALRAAVKTPNCAIGSHTHAPHPRLDSARASVVQGSHDPSAPLCSASAQNYGVPPPHQRDTEHRFRSKNFGRRGGVGDPGFFRGHLTKWQRLG